MKLPALLLALAAALLAPAALAADEAAAPAATPTADADAPKHGEKEHKERINLVARKPHRHDIGWLDSHDRATWREFTTWQGVRDERPLVARKTLGFHEPRPHMRRWDRVMMLARGPLVGPPPAR